MKWKQVSDVLFSGKLRQKNPPKKNTRKGRCENLHEKETVHWFTGSLAHRPTLLQTYFEICFWWLTRWISLGFICVFVVLFFVFLNQRNRMNFPSSSFIFAMELLLLKMAFCLHYLCKNYGWPTAENHKRIIWTWTKNGHTSTLFPYWLKIGLWEPTSHSELRKIHYCSVITILLQCNWDATRSEVVMALQDLLFTVQFS